MVVLRSPFQAQLASLRRCTSCNLGVLKFPSEKIFISGQSSTTNLSKDGNLKAQLPEQKLVKLFKSKSFNSFNSLKVITSSFATTSSTSTISVIITHDFIFIYLSRTRDFAIEDVNTIFNLSQLNTTRFVRF
ncbi:hypothetical protein CISIN_1g032872mg [Citrus sinensis]|uniref:Uncharacterized protein n=1 Tax=Citrus sinensis TaxID=2711 RepID=A0A067DCD9_CITSI|nr:hypothetical protein CISIN_1g032872mg [Citrus sinensis]